MRLLIVSLHARSLAQSARRGGHAVSVADLYDDVDTRSFADQSKRMMQKNGGFDADKLIDEVNGFCPPPAGLVTGSGFENDPALLTLLAQGREFYGNTGEAVRRVKDPATFFPLLDKLSIPHPETLPVRPAMPQGWVMKRVGGHGGTHIQPADRAALPGADSYFQRVQEGSNCSVLFLANGKKARIVGFNEQFTTNQLGSPYWYAGAVNRAVMLQCVRCDIVRKLDSLVTVCDLVGLNSIDFITAGENYWVLEVNPRPTATMDLYDDDFPTGLFDWHLRACRGELPGNSPVGKVRAHGVVYAEHTLRLQPRYQFPAWCTDIPEPGSEFIPGAAVCMVHAEGSSTNEVKRLLEQRLSLMQRSLFRKAA